MEHTMLGKVYVGFLQKMTRISLEDTIYNGKNFFILEASNFVMPYSAFSQ